MEVFENRGYPLGVPVIRILLFWGYIMGCPYLLGNPHMAVLRCGEMFCGCSAWSLQCDIAELLAAKRHRDQTLQMQRESI